MHKNYLKMFNESLPSDIHQMIDRFQNCEDISMNVMVGDYLARLGCPQPSGLFIHTKSIQYIGYLASKRILNVLVLQAWGEWYNVYCVFIFNPLCACVQRGLL